MEPDISTYDQLLAAYEELRFQLDEAKDTIHAIRTGQVDAFIVQGENGHQLYTLKTADQTYRVFIEKMNEGAVTLNRAGLILYSNSRFGEMIDRSSEPVLGLAFERFVSGNSKEKFRAVIEKGWTEDAKEEIMLLANDQRQIPCLLSCNTLELDEGTALSLILTDLTIQKVTERVLKAKNEELAAAQNATEQLNDELEDIVAERTRELMISQEHFRLLADNIPQMSWTNLPGGEVNFYNQQWYDYTRRDFEQSGTWDFQHVVHPDDLDQTFNRYQKALASGQTFEVENRYKNADGVYRWHLNRAVPLKNKNGEIVFWVGTATDIEDQKQQTQKRDEFIGIASHELKTPMTSLKGYLQIIAGYKREELPLFVKSYVDKANTALNKLQNLVNDLLDVSKIQAGRLDYLMQPVELAALLQDSTENARDIYPEYKFDYFKEKDCRVMGNVERLDQVIMNFINNAVKYSPESNEIAIRIAPFEGSARVSVTDHGVGLSTDEMTRIFERFYRVEDKKFMTSGLGMGLYICAEIISAHEGQIGVNSEIGVGSTFYFDLPLMGADR